MRTFRRLFLLCVLTLPAIGCRSTDSGRSPALPFHVAIIPLAIEKQGVSDEQFQLEFTQDLVCDALAEELGGERFTRATVLSYPEDGPPFSERSEYEQDEHWLYAAEKAGADLILQGTFTYVPAIETESNKSGWVNAVLFLMGGPFSWGYNDRGYRFQARLAVDLYDLSPMRESARVVKEADLRNASSRLLQASHDLQETTLDMIDRTNYQQHRSVFRTNPGPYLASILVPPTWLSKRTKWAKRSLEYEIVNTLAAEVATEFVNERSQLLSASELVDFLPPAKLAGAGKAGADDWEVPPGKLTVNGDGSTLEGEVWLRVGRVTAESVVLSSGTDRMESVVLWNGAGSPEEFPLIENAPKNVGGARYIPYTFAIPLPASANLDELRLEFRDGEANQSARSFTYFVQR